MIWPQLQTVAPLAIGRILNSLPEGLLLALFAWIMLRLLPRQNSGTRFAVWFVALLAVAGLPFVGSSALHSFSASGVARPAINLPREWGLFLLLAWILASSIAIVRLAAGVWRLRKLRKSCVAIDVATLDPSVRKTIAGFNSPRSVSLATSETVNVPAALGFFNPMVVIPAWALRELPPEELSIILLHEFAHLRRLDDWTNLLQKIVRAVLPFHPAVWWIENRLSLEREMACDDLVLAETANPRGYAKCLIALLEKSLSRRGLALAQAAVHRVQEASLRLSQILDVRHPKTKHVWKPALACVGTFSAICLALAPHAPRLVAFEQSPEAIHSVSSDLRTFGAPPSYPASVVIPAALRTRSTTALAPLLQSHAVPVSRHVAGNISQQVVQHRRAVPTVRPAISAEAQHIPVHIVNARAQEQEPFSPSSETLLLIRTSQQTGPDSWSWSVSVWRVIWTNPNQNRAEKAPIAHKT
jgi:beta-lactamase regulating signal transducer with metallopeptidase domain